MYNDMYFMHENSTLTEVINRLDQLKVKTLFILRDGVLVASVTDGDIRRAILKGIGLTTPVSQFANYSPICLAVDSNQNRDDILVKKGIYAIPMVDEKKRVVDIYIGNDVTRIQESQPMDLPVIIMAGGLGTRLYPYTKILPKPLIPIEDTPISERIIHSFYEKGCKRFFMIVNHKKNMIKAYFNDIKKLYDLEFVDENKPLGTGGGIWFLKDKIKETFVLTNCDILIMDDLSKIVEHHREMENDVTMVCSLKNYEIPYGVVNFSEGGAIESFDEKPHMSFFTNTGYYILEPSVFQYVQKDEYIGMPDVVMRMKEGGLKVGIYPIGENAWLDMGQMDSMDIMERRLREI